MDWDQCFLKVSDLAASRTANIIVDCCLLNIFCYVKSWSGLGGQLARRYLNGQLAIYHSVVSFELPENVHVKVLLQMTVIIH